MRFIADLLISALILLLVSQLVPGFKLPSFTAALIAAFVISLLNFFIKPLLLFLTLPINLLTLGLFTFVISGLILKLADIFLEDFEISNFSSALVAAVLIALFSTLIKILISKKN